MQCATGTLPAAYANSSLQTLNLGGTGVSVSACQHACVHALQQPAAAWLRLAWLWTVPGPAPGSRQAGCNAGASHQPRHSRLM